MLFTRACCWTEGITVDSVKLHSATCPAGTQITGSSYLGCVGKENRSLNTEIILITLIVFAEAL